jgi:hypothetical protein
MKETHHILKRIHITSLVIKFFGNIIRPSRSRYSNCLRTSRPGGQSSSPCRVNSFLFSTASKPDLGLTRPPIQWAPGPLSPGVKRQGREADHSPPTSAEVKKMWIYIFTPPYAFMV